MERLYHGTTEESCRSILANGFSHDAVVWTCSDPDMMYFYDQGMVAKEFDLTPGKARERCFELALQSAFTTAAITNSLSQNLFLLEVQVPDYLTNIILPDQSTGLWDGFDVCVPTTALNRLPFNVYAAMDCYSPRLAILSLSVLAHNEYLPIMRLTRLEQDVIAEMNESAIEPFLTTVNDFFSQFRPTQLYHGIHVGQIPNMDDPAKRIRSLERQGGMDR